MSANGARNAERFNWVMRVASRPEVGGGHVARCLTLARSLDELGQRTAFVLDNDGMRWRDLVAGEGYGCFSASDIDGVAAPGCLIDTYDIDERSVEPWRRKSRLMAAMVDHQPVPAWAELAIAPAMAPAEVSATHAKVLAGLNYAIIEPRFAAQVQHAPSNTVRNVLVSFGQRDSRNATCLALDALQSLHHDMKPFSITVALGGEAPHIQTARERVAVCPGARLEADADMVRCYAAADFVVGGGGVGLLERMAQGLPSLSIGLAENQRNQIAVCAKASGTVDAGQVSDLDATKLAAILSPLLRSPERRATMGAAARRAVDGRGAYRCARAISAQLNVHAKN